MRSIFYINIYKNNNISYAISLIHIILFILVWWIAYHFYKIETNEHIIYTSLISILAIVWTLILLINCIYVVFAFNNNAAINAINKKIIGDAHLTNHPTAIDGEWIKDKIIGQYAFDDTIYTWYDWLRFYKISLKPASYIISGLYIQQKSHQPIINTYTSQAVQNISPQKQIKDDLFSFKAFEMGDDPRRIVWKIYGKSRTLHVRKADDSSASKQTLNIKILPPINDYNIDTELYIILQSEYKRQVLDTLYQWENEAQLNISLENTIFDNIKAFQQVWLDDIKTKTAIDTVYTDAIVLTNNFSHHSIVQNENILVFNYTFSNTSRLKSRIIFRSSKESIRLRKRINQTNQILKNNTAIITQKSHQQLTTVIQISDT